MVGLLALVLFTACSENGENTTTESNTTETNASGNGAGTAAANGESNTAGGATGTYVDLYTGAPIEIERDETSGNYVNRMNHETVQFYVNTSTSDTFDMKGRMVNNALLRTSEGQYTINEAKVKVDSDGDIKIKDGDTKIKYDESSGSIKVKDGDSKEKLKDDKYKKKTEDTKVKVKDGEVKVKDNR